MTKDLNYLATTTQLQKVPFKIKGSNTGAAKLLQRCITLLFSEYDEVLRPMAIGLYDKLKSANIHKGTADSLKSLIIQDINTIQLNIVTAQKLDSTLSPEERLVSLELTSFNITDRANLEIVLTVTTEAGTAASVKAEV
jgi:hypothetical protein